MTILQTKWARKVKDEFNLFLTLTNLTRHVGEERFYGNNSLLLRYSFLITIPLFFLKNQNFNKSQSTASSPQLTTKKLWSWLISTKLLMYVLPGTSVQLHKWSTTTECRMSWSKRHYLNCSTKCWFSGFTILKHGWNAFQQ